MNAVKASAPHLDSPLLYNPSFEMSAGTGAPAQVVYARTVAGHQEVLMERTLLQPAERRLLRMVTGLTPLDVLAPPTSGIVDPLAAAARLLAVGLIEPVEADQRGRFTPN